MNRMRHIGVPLLLIGISLLTSAAAMAQGNQPLQSFTAVYQLNRGRMIMGKVTTTLQLEPNGGYTYKSITIPVGIVAAFSKDEITEISRGKIQSSRVTPTSYEYHHKRKKRPKLRKLQFDWTTNQVSAPGTNPLWSSAITPGIQDKASKILSMMLSMNQSTTDIKIQVVNKNKLKTYVLSKVKQEQIKTADTSFDTIKLSEAKQRQPVSTRFWLAPELNYLPVKIERKEKKDTFTMTLSRFSRN